MSRTTWIVDGERFAGKIISASHSGDPNAASWRSNPTRSCPKCSHIIDNSDVSQEWPGLPKGVKFDPTDQELLWHLIAKVGVGGAEAHPFIDAFIPTIEGVDGICYTHPKKLPGIKQDGCVSHFFHRTFKAYNTGTRKRRKISDDAIGDVRWHKTGKTKPVILNGIHYGCKKIMVLYMNAKGEKPEKTNWVMHEYHLGMGEDEKDGEFVVSKVFYQQQTKQNDKSEADPSSELDIPAENEKEDVTAINPVLVTPEPPEKRIRSLDLEQVQKTGTCEPETKDDGTDNNGEKVDDHHHYNPSQDSKWWEGESQYLLDSQQLAEGIAMCEEFLQSQSSCGGGSGEGGGPSKSCLSDYASLGPGNLKQDLLKCQELTVADPHHLDVTLDTPDLRLSQLEFESQDSFLSWGVKKVAD